MPFHWATVGGNCLEKGAEVEASIGEQTGFDAFILLRGITSNKGDD
jgi:hypothetical protein